MTNPRLLYNVLDQLMLHIPEGNEKLVKSLQEHRNDSVLRAPEDTTPWWSVHETLEEFIPDPKEDWEMKLVRIWSNTDEL